MTKKIITQMSYEILGLAIKVHKELGPGLLEIIYEKCLLHELIKNGFIVEEQKCVPIIYDGIKIDTDLKLDLLVNDSIIIELKSVNQISPIHEAQILSYMKLLKKPQGLLINFNSIRLTKSTKPFVNEYFRVLPDF